MANSSSPNGDGDIKSLGINVFGCKGISMDRLAEFLGFPDVSSE
jgi:hypothetical protein